MDLYSHDGMICVGGGLALAFVVMLSCGDVSTKNRPCSAPNIGLKNKCRQARDKLKDLLDLLSGIIAAAAAKAIAKGKQFGRHHKHHIIARGALAAAPARLVYVWLCQRDIDGEPNLVSIRDCVHYFLHNTAYYSTINLLITGAYSASGIAGVDNMLERIKGVLKQYG